MWLLLKLHIRHIMIKNSYSWKYILVYILIWAVVYHRFLPAVTLVSRYDIQNLITFRILKKIARKTLESSTSYQNKPQKLFKNLWHGNMQLNIGQDRWYSKQSETRWQRSRQRQTMWWPDNSNQIRWKSFMTFELYSF